MLRVFCNEIARSVIHEVFVPDAHAYPDVVLYEGRAYKRQSGEQYVECSLGHATRLAVATKEEIARSQARSASVHSS